MKKELRNLVEERRGEGSQDSSGDFTLDHGLAVEKMVEYGLDTPEKGLLKLVQLGVRAGAKSVDLRLKRHRLELRLPGLDTSKLELETLDQAAQLDPDHLGLALRAALRTGFDDGYLTSDSLAWHLEPGGFIACTPIPVGGGIRLVLNRAAPGSFWTRLKRWLRGRCLNHSLLWNSLALCPVPVKLDAVAVNGSPIKGKCYLELTLTAPRRYEPFGVYGVTGRSCRDRWVAGDYSRGHRNWDTLHRQYVGAKPSWFGFERSSRWKTDPQATCLAHLWVPTAPRAEGRLLLVADGVLVGEHPWPNTIGVSGVVSAEGLDLDLSGLAVIDNSKLDVLKRRLEKTARKYLTRLNRVPKTLQNDLNRRLGRQATVPVKKPKKKKNKRGPGAKSDRSYQGRDASRSTFRTQRRQHRERFDR